MLERELQWEKELFFFLNGSESVFWDNFFWIYSCKWTWIPFYLFFLFVFCYKQDWKTIVRILLSITLVIVLCDQVASGICKPFFHRFRPTHHPDFQDQVDIVMGYRGGRYGFISSHAANAFGLAAFTALLFRNRLFTGMILLFALLNAYSRIYLGLHFISDVVAGALAGVLLGAAGYAAARFRLNKPVFPPWEIQLLCLVYALSLLIMLLFNNQIVNLFFKN
jgi:undecaprenyl-diphosphatase